MSVNARLNVNVALKRPAYQASTWYDYGVSDAYVAERANDGDHNPNLLARSCVHTNSATNPWWAVDLGVALHVYGIRFTNRDGSRTYEGWSKSFEPGYFSLYFWVKNVTG